MASSADGQHGFFDGYGTYPSEPSFPPRRGHARTPGPQPAYPPRPGHPPPPHYSPPPTYRPTVPAHADTELVRLRTAYRWLRRSMTLAVLGYYTVYLVLAAYLPDLMAQSVFGSVNLGVFLGLLLIPVTLLTVVTYELFARATVDPLSHRVRIADEEQRESEEENR
ncbi:uncharacterized membrane protein (DUF485 family) [Streptomyces sp. Amel2xB2]|uniref:DUF485 domain-containing protein n=1 Tax=Streptomyces sp. Amel2xB2 TaxID=1305829 RepID=UPI000DBAB551|nr:DUF485 domain-containing protein [Streptomyces sp. Amel2xB2]RAJ62518.1 uncharacterized membrane protein (DUF485 family) [Streptomyces sp. Amel2xB2]